MIGYYVHHHGSGHLARAAVIARACRAPVVGLSSLPEPTPPQPFAGWVSLSGDPALDDPVDPTGGGAVHWAPLNSAGYAQRMHELVQWCAATRPDAVVVDLSVEVAALLRLVGVPVVLMTLPGRRDDTAHELAFRLASRIIAPWPQDVYNPPHLHPYAGKTSYAGAVSRFDTLAAPPAAATRRLLALSGSGGGIVTDGQVSRAAAALSWQGRALGGASWSDDVHRELGEAQLVVTHAGTNSLAEIAAVRRPAVVIAQERPYGEQRATADALHAAGIATVVPAWPSADEWPGVASAALARGGSGWQRWHDGRGAQRIAAVLHELVAP